MTRIFAPRPLPLLLCAAAALTSFSALAFQQSGKITAGSDMTFFLTSTWKTISQPVLTSSCSMVWRRLWAVKQ